MNPWTSSTQIWNKLISFIELNQFFYFDKVIRFEVGQKLNSAVNTIEFFLRSHAKIHTTIILNRLIEKKVQYKFKFVLFSEWTNDRRIKN